MWSGRARAPASQRPVGRPGNECAAGVALQLPRRVQKAVQVSNTSQQRAGGVQEPPRRNRTPCCMALREDARRPFPLQNTLITVPTFFQATERVNSPPASAPPSKKGPGVAWSSMQGTGTVVGEWRFRIASARGHGSRPGERRRSRLLWPAPRALLCSWAGRVGCTGNLAGGLRRPAATWAAHPPAASGGGGSSCGPQACSPGIDSAASAAVAGALASKHDHPAAAGCCQPSAATATLPLRLPAPAWHLPTLRTQPFMALLALQCRATSGCWRSWRRERRALAMAPSGVAAAGCGHVLAGRAAVQQ